MDLDIVPQQVVLGWYGAIGPVVISWDVDLPCFIAAESYTEPKIR